MIVAEIAASAVECMIMAEFLTRFMGLKNDRYKIAKTAICFLLLFADVVCHAKRKKLTSKIQKIRQRKNFLADLKHI